MGNRLQVVTDWRIKAMSAQNCTTHHYACDCREAKFAEIARDNETLREDLDNAHNTIRGMEVQQERLERENAALRAALTPWLAWEDSGGEIPPNAARELFRIARIAIEKR